MNNSRLDTTRKVSEATYHGALLNIISVLAVELIEDLYNNSQFQVEQIRKHALSISGYFGDIRPETDILSGTSDTEFETYEKIAYLLKPDIIKEYKRFLERGLTSSESCVLIMRCLIRIVPDHTENLKDVSRCISWFTNNIKSRARKDTAYNLTVTIKEHMRNGDIGKYGLVDLNIMTADKPKETLKGESIRVNKSNNSLVEVSWKRN